LSIKINTYSKVIFILNSKQKKQLITLLLLVFVGMFFEVGGLGIILPVINVINNSNFLNEHDNFKIFFTIFGELNQSRVIIITMIYLVLFYLLKSIFLTYLYWEQTYFSSNFTAFLSNKLYNGYLNMPYENHIDNNSAILIRNIQSEVGIFTTLTQQIIFLSTEFSVILGLVFLLFSIEPKGAFALFLTLTISVLFFYLISKKRVKKLGVLRQQYSGEMTKNLMQGLGGIKDIKLTSAETYFLNDFEIKNKKSAKINTLINVLDQLPRIYLEFIAVGGLSSLIIIMVLNNQPLTHIIPILGIFIGAAFRMIPSVNKIMYATQKVTYCMPVINLIYDEFKSFIDLSNENKMISKELNFSNEINIKNISFQYQSANSLILRNISLNIKKGDFIGIMGESGSGKSTLIDVILGLLQPNNGGIYVDNLLIDDNNKKSWQQIIGYVPQVIYLTDDTLRRNIAFGIDENKIDDELIQRSIRDAQLENFVESLTEGINTVVGERGVRLSGGQRQRIGIARAIYKKSQILILDEATSALDSETESDVMEALFNIKKSKTIILVAHRLTTLQNCDFLYKMNQGEIIMKGKPKEIL
jgi:ABC-type multidrug transport system fused ATPase/permease subunit